MDLDDLVNQVEESAVSDEPLDRLAAAMGVKADLDDVADRLIGVFVDRARHAGCSWSEIGAAMGVTKQAAQQRHAGDRRPPRERPPWRVGRWTDRAKAVVREAGRAAADLGHDYVGTEHVLLGMLAIPQGIAGRILAAAGVTRDTVLAATASPGPVVRPRRRHVPFTPRAKEALGLSLQNAVRLGHNYIGTEHQLLGLFDVPEGIGAQVLAGAGMTKADVEAQVFQMLRAAS